MPSLPTAARRRFHTARVIAKRIKVARDIAHHSASRLSLAAWVVTALMAAAEIETSALLSAQGGSAGLGPRVRVHANAEAGAAAESSVQSR